MESSVLTSLLTWAFGLGTILAGIFGFFISNLINRTKSTPPHRSAILKDLLVEVSKQITEVNKSTHKKTMQFKECTIEVAIEAETQTSGSTKSEILQIYVLEWGGSSKQAYSNKITLKYQPITNQQVPQAPVIPKNTNENPAPGWSVTHPTDKSEEE